MKYRSDFVTNSSSSSFLIGKPGVEDISVESVYQTLRNFYLDYQGQVERLKADAHKYKLKFSKGTFKAPESMSWDDRCELDKVLEDEYGLTTWEWVPDLDWLKNETYADYQKYWVEKLKVSDKTMYAPFSIYDYLNPADDYIALEDGSWALKEPAKAAELNFHILGWYAPCGDHLIEGIYDPKEYCYCDSCHIGPKDSIQCKAFWRKIQTENVTPENSVAMLLGRVCIHSESGYIPEFIVNKLREISEFSCNHMG